MISATTETGLIRADAGAPERHPMVVTIGGGGAYAFGFALGVAHGLRMEGVDLRGVPIVGTSGGSHAAVAIAAGLGFDEVASAWREYVGSARRFRVRSAPLAEQLYGDLDVTEVAGVAIRVRWFRRVLLTAPEVRPADLVAASSSPFPFVRPHKVDGRRHVDGGHRSNTSADLAPAADLQVVLAAFTGPSQGFIGRLAARQLPKETRKWRLATGGRTVVIGPDDDICAIKVKGMGDLANMDLGRQVYDRSIPIGRAQAGVLRRDHPEIIDRST